MKKIILSLFVIVLAEQVIAESAQIRIDQENYRKLKERKVLSTNLDNETHQTIAGNHAKVIFRMLEELHESNPDKIVTSSHWGPMSEWDRSPPMTFTYQSNEASCSEKMISVVDRDPFYVYECEIKIITE